jgi:hypothetical protein
LSVAITPADLAPVTSAASGLARQERIFAQVLGLAPGQRSPCDAIAGPSQVLKPLPYASCAIAWPYDCATPRSNVDASSCADGNAVVPAARTPFGPSVHVIAGTPKPATLEKSPRATSTFWSTSWP